MDDIPSVPGGGPPTLPELPSSLMTDGGRILARAIAKQQLSAPEVVKAVWAFAMQVC